MTWHYTDIFNFHSRVREVLNSNIVTDEQINRFEKAPASEIYIKDIVKNWQEIKEKSEMPAVTEEELKIKEEAIIKFKIFESCIVYHTAIKLEKFVDKRSIKSKKVPSITIEYAVSTSEENSPTLKEELDELLSLLTVFEKGNTGFFFGFKVT